MWSEFDLENPSGDIVKYIPQENFRAENLQTLISELTEAANAFASEDLLWRETDSLKDIQDKYQNCYNCTNFLTVLHRVCHCLKKMVFLNLSKMALDLAERFLKGFKEDSMTPCLPSRQQLTFLLFRIQAAAKLVCEVIGYAQDVFCYVTELKNSSNISATRCITSFITKICLLLQGTLDKLCESYKKVIAYRYKLKLGSHKWTERLRLPLDLRIWIYGSDTSVSKFLYSERFNANIVLDAESGTSFDTNTSASNNPIDATPKDSNSKSGGTFIARSNARHLQVTESEKEADDLVEINSVASREKEGLNTMDDAEKEACCKSGESLNIQTNAQHSGVSEPDEDADGVVEITSEVSEDEDLVPCDESPIPNVDLDVSLVSPRQSLTKKQKIVLRKILIAKSYKNLEAVWKKVKSFYRNDLLINLSARKEMIISKFLKRAKQNYLHFKSHKHLKGNMLLRIRKSHYVKFALYLGYTLDHIDSFTRNNPIFFNYGLKKHIKTFKTLKLLYSQLLSNLRADKKGKQCKELKAEFKRRANDVRVLVKNGEKQCAKRMITCISKVLLSLYNT